MTSSWKRPDWLTFDCYGTLIQWDEGLIAAVRRILRDSGSSRVEPTQFIAAFDRHEHELEAERPHKSFRVVASESLRRTMQELGLADTATAGDTLTTAIASMPPFPEVVDALAQLRRLGFRLCVISNTDDDIIAGNIAQLGGTIDKVITAQQAQAYKPSRVIFEHAYRALHITRDDVLHICASPHLDLAAARDLGFRCIWIDRGTGRKPLPDYVPDRTFSSLAQVPEFLAGFRWS